MSLAFYHLAHLVGLIAVFIGFGCLMGNVKSRSAMKWHGIGLIISLISGFGMLAKLQIFASMPSWVLVKIALWLVLGFLPVLARRGKLSPERTVVLAAILGLVLGGLGYLKPALGSASALQAAPAAVAPAAK